MPIIRTFCTWFSLRLGCIFLATFSLIQATVIIIITIVAHNNPELLSEYLESIKNQNDLLFVKPYYEYFQANTNQILSIIAIFHVIYIVSCLTLIHGAFKLKEWTIIPYVVLELLRWISITISSILISTLMKKNVLDFNVLLLGIVIFGLILFTLGYFWLCPFSLLLCLIENRNQNSRIPHTMPPKFENVNSTNLSHLYAYFYEFHKQQQQFLLRHQQRNSNKNMTPLYF